jgi:hypothetical protein
MSYCKKINAMIFLRDKKYSSGREINMNIWPCGEPNAISNEEENISDSSSKQHVTWAKLGAKQPHFPFTCTWKPGINIYLEDPNNS